jgi:hypothetical protein
MVESIFEKQKEINTPHQDTYGKEVLVVLGLP